MDDFIEIEIDNVDTQEIMRKIRAEIKKKKALGVYPAWMEERLNAAPNMPQGPHGISTYLRGMQNSWQIDTDQKIRSGRPGLGPVIVLIKKTTRRLVRWYMDDVAEQIMRFHSYTASAMGIVTERLDKTETDLNQKFIINSEITERVKRLERRTTVGKQPAKAAIATPPADSESEPVDYLVFENKFRGDSAKIAERQRLFLEYFRGQKDVLDLGCGRGEFLNLLKEANIPARGVDLSEDFIEVCRDKGLDIQQGDALAYLANLKTNSLGGIFAGQVIEHFSTSQLVRLVKLAYEKLRPGAYFVAETVNPLCLSVFAKSFYIDPTHVKPVHPETIQFILESEGFDFVKVHFMSPPPDESKLALIEVSADQDPEDKKRYQQMNENVEKLNQLLYSYEDYAVVARKPAKE
jgi:SAM-dependent methyltransferase